MASRTTRNGILRIFHCRACFPRGMRRKSGKREFQLFKNFSKSPRRMRARLATTADRDALRSLGTFRDEMFRIFQRRASLPPRTERKFRKKKFQNFKNFSKSLRMKGSRARARARRESFATTVDRDAPRSLTTIRDEIFRVFHCRASLPRGIERKIRKKKFQNFKNFSKSPLPVVCPKCVETYIYELSRSYEVARPPRATVPTLGKLAL